MSSRKLTKTSLFSKGDAIFSLGALAYWLIHLFLVIFSYLSPKLGIVSLPVGYFEAGDKFAFMGLIVIVLMATSNIVSHDSRLFRWASNGALKIICMIIFLSSAIALPTHVTSPSTTFTGFGTTVTFLIVILLPGMLFLVANQPLPAWINRRSQDIFSIAGVGLALLVVYVYVPVLIQPIWGLHDIYHASFNLNEILGPITGRFPLVDFLSMYSNFFGLLYAGLGAFGPISSYPLFFAPLYLSVFSLLTIGLSVATIMILLPKGQKWLAVLLIIPLVLVGSQDLSSQRDTIMASFSNIPGRMFFPVLLGFLLTWSRFRLSAVIDMIGAGIIIGISVFNNLESGIALATSFLVLLFVIMNDHPDFKRNLLCFFVALPLPFIVYIVVFFFRGTPVRLDWFFAMIKAFSTGLMSLPAPLSGFHFVVFPLALTIVSTTILSYHRRGGVLRNNLWSCRYSVVSVQAASSLLALYYAMLIFAMAPYFLARSSMWGQLQSFLLPFSLSTAACLVYRVYSLNSEDFDVIKLRSTYPLFVVALSASLSFASITLHPDSLSEYQRIFARPYFHALENGVPITSSPLWSQFRLDKLDPHLFPSVNHLPQESITVLSEFPNMRQAENPQTSLRFTLPATRFEFLELPAIRKKLCDRIQPLLMLESTLVIPSEKRDFLLRSCNNR